MQASVRKWGNSAAIRIPGSILDAANLSLDQAVEIREQDGRIIIEPVRPIGDELALLISAITDENRHAEVDFGDPIGAEIP